MDSHSIVLRINNDSGSDVDNAFHQVSAAVLGQTIADVFYYWDWKTTTDHNTVKIENGKMVKNDYRTDNYGFTYYFDSNGIGTKQ